MGESNAGRQGLPGAPGLREGEESGTVTSIFSGRSRSHLYHLVTARQLDEVGRVCCSRGSFQLVCVWCRVGLVVRNAPLLKSREHPHVGVLEATSHLIWKTARMKPRSCFLRVKKYPGWQPPYSQCAVLAHSRCSVAGDPLLRLAQRLQAGGHGGKTLPASSHPPHGDLRFRCQI